MIDPSRFGSNVWWNN